MKSFYLLLIVLALAIGGVVLRATHHPVYGGCSPQSEGYTCTLTSWKGNK